MILACGEALIDMLPRSSTLGEPAFAPHAGGAVFNTAVALGRLGADVGLFSGISTDMLGDILIDSLQAAQVNTTHTARSARPTTIALVKLVDGQASYAFYDENTAGRLLGAADLPPPGAAKAYFFGGISLMAEPSGQIYEDLQAREAAYAVTMIDPNIRPSFITNEAAYRSRLSAMIARADIVKVSDEDLRWIMGEGPIEDLANALLAKGPALVCVTEGAQGARGFGRIATAHAPSIKVDVVDTVGAGDTFNAGVLFALQKANLLDKHALQSLTPAQIAAALTMGNRTAAITVSRAGANPPWSHEL